MNDAPGDAHPPELLLAHSDFVRRLALELVGDQATADDVAQDALSTAWRHRPEALRQPRAWLAAVVRNFARQQHRAEVRRKTHEDRLPAGGRAPSPDEVLAREELRRSVVAAVLALPPQYRDLVLLRFYEALPPRTIAKRLALPVETVRTRLKRALLQLRSQLGEAGPGKHSPAALASLAVPGTTARTLTPLLFRLSGVPRLATAVAAMLTIAGAAYLMLPSSPPLPTQVRPIPTKEAHAEGDDRHSAAERVASTIEPGDAPSTRFLAPNTTLRVTADVAGFGSLSSFEVRTQFSAGGPAHTVSTETGSVIQQIPLVGEEQSLSVTIAKPPFGSVTERVLAHAGEALELHVHLAPAEHVDGVVVGSDGAPLAGALVWFGTMDRLRGDEPFKPFQVRRAGDAARTDESGRFHLRGMGTVVSVFHAEASPRTVAVLDAARIELGALGRIEGRLVDREGNPRVCVEVRLDRERPVQTDAEGRFRFANVFAGVRGICLPDKQYLGLRVAPGAESRVEIGRDLQNVQIHVPGLGALPGTPRGVVLVGSSDVAAVYACQAEGDRLTLPAARPGNYLVWNGDGPVATCQIDGNVCQATLGTCALELAGPPGMRVFLVPAGENELLDVLAPRAAPRTIDNDGIARFPALPAGDYHVVEVKTRRRHEIVVRESVTSVRLE
jgi:RNA polymerase sigma-70 factor (ECF subfamily)